MLAHAGYGPAAGLESSLIISAIIEGDFIVISTHRD